MRRQSGDHSGRRRSRSGTTAENDGGARCHGRGIGAVLDPRLAGSAGSGRRITRAALAAAYGRGTTAGTLPALDATLSARAITQCLGPAECADDVAYHHIVRPPGGPRVPIGRPVENIRLYILDRYLDPVPIGVPGELCVADVGVGRGYLGRPDLTAAAFIPDPFGETAGGRLYRTGDLACYRPDGAIEYLGRLDHQVKVRGFRIELGEIEARLLQHPAINEAAVIAREDSPGVKRLVAYVVTSADARWEPEALDPLPSPPPAREREDTAQTRLIDDLRAHLRETLPEYMLHAAFVCLPALPLNANGKLDRQALPAPDFAGQLQANYVAPHDETESILTGIWAEVLSVEQVGIHDNFFELGGDSILSIQVVSRAKQAGVLITPRLVFERPTIAQLAAAASLVELPRPSSPLTEQGRISGEVALTPIQCWFFEQGLGNPHHWNQAVMLEPTPALDLQSLEKALQHLIDHHDALRLRFKRTAETWQQVCLEHAEQMGLHRVDLSDASDDELAAAIVEQSSAWQAQLNPLGSYSPPLAA